MSRKSKSQVENKFRCTLGGEKKLSTNARLNPKSNPSINRFVWLVDGEPLARVTRVEPTPEIIINRKAARLLVELFDQAEIRQLHWDVGKQNASLHQRVRHRGRAYELDLSQLARLVGGDRASTFSSFLSLVGATKDKHDDDNDQEMNDGRKLFVERLASRKLGRQNETTPPLNLINFAKWSGQEDALVQFKCLAANELGERASQSIAGAGELISARTGRRVEHNCNAIHSIDSLSLSFSHFFAIAQNKTTQMNKTKNDDECEM